MTITATTHRIIATDWQLEAAQGRLRAVIMPLVPEAEMLPKSVRTDDDYWEWKAAPVALVWGKDELPGSYLLNRLPYRVGDRLYLAQVWTEYDDEYILRVQPDCEVSEAEDGWMDWQPAATMPPEAAQWWFTVTGVRVVQCKVLQFADLSKTGIFYACPGINYPHDEMRAVWDDAHPDYTWADDRWVVVMEVKNVKESA